MTALSKKRVPKIDKPSQPLIDRSSSVNDTSQRRASITTTFRFDKSTLKLNLGKAKKETTILVDDATPSASHRSADASKRKKDSSPILSGRRPINTDLPIIVGVEDLGDFALQVSNFRNFSACSRASPPV